MQKLSQLPGLLPRQEDVTKQLHDDASNHPLLFIGTTHLFSNDDLSIAKLGSLTDDYERHLRRYASTNLQFSAAFLLLAVDELKKRFPKESILTYFKKGALLQSEEQE